MIISTYQCINNAVMWTKGPAWGLAEGREPTLLLIDQFRGRGQEVGMEGVVLSEPF